MNEAELVEEKPKKGRKMTPRIEAAISLAHPIDLQFEMETFEWMKDCSLMLSSQSQRVHLLPEGWFNI